MAACSLRAAGGAGDRLARHDLAWPLCALCRRVPRRPWRRGLRRGEKRRDRIPLGEGHYDRLPALAADLVGRKVNLIITSGGPPAAHAAKSATSTIPIAFIASDPVEFGLVDR